MESPFRHSQEQVLHPSFSIERPFQRTLDKKLLECWAEGIPYFPDHDPEQREWEETPTYEVDLREIGYGKVLVKDESVNPTGTIKDRASWEIVTLYRDYAFGLLEQLRMGSLSETQLRSIVVPRFTVISSGNEARALATAFAAHGLPPIKVIVDQGIGEQILQQLKELHIDLYQIDLTAQSLTAQRIKDISNNQAGNSLTAARWFAPERVFYDWHVFESFNQRPDHIFLPYGSGKLASCYLYWQKHLVHNSLLGEQQDPRLDRTIDHRELMQINIMAAEPEAYPSLADKLHAPFKPFQIFSTDDLSALRNFGFSGKHTGIYGVSEERLQTAYQTMRSKGIHCEPSSTAGLALYMEQVDAGKVSKHSRVLIINTGKGLLNESQ